MTPSEEKFVNHWAQERKKWNWGRNFINVVLYIAIPFVVLTDLVNFFIIGDVRYAFISLKHFTNVFINFFIISLLSGFGYGIVHWNTNEIRYWNILKKYKQKE